ncbi:hypothetical protein Bca4012_000906 [Brassica carinata]|nr:PREDICTED: uncharacterized protein LOC106334283 [Brassica oleracea var. oleracea]
MPSVWGKRTHLLWKADRWLPDKYEEPGFICLSLGLSVSRRGFSNEHIRVYGNSDIFSEDLEHEYFLSPECDNILRFSKEEAHQINYMMLVDAVLMASHDDDHVSPLVIITKLAQDTEMICRVLASLTSRGFPVLFALPEAPQSNFGITVSSNVVLGPERIPVLLCPHLFDLLDHLEHEEEDEDVKHSQRYFIELPPPDAHTKSFSMPQGVETCVFWDVSDYPLPLGLQLPVFYENILSAVRALVPCPCGGISIYAYVDNDEFDYEDARVLITVVRNSPADKFSRLAKMTMDFLLWSIDNPADPHGTRGPNLLLISKLLQDDELNCLHKLDNLSTNGLNVFLTSEKIPRKVNYVHLLSWQDLSAVGKLKSREDTHY